MGIKGELGDGFPQPKPAFIARVCINIPHFLSFLANFLVANCVLMTPFFLV